MRKDFLSSVKWIFHRAGRFDFVRTCVQLKLATNWSTFSLQNGLWSQSMPHELFNCYLFLALKLNEEKNGIARTRMLNVCCRYKWWSFCWWLGKWSIWMAIVHSGNARGIDGEWPMHRLYCCMIRRLWDEDNWIRQVLIKWICMGN